ncbi:MAG: hypothetical protein RLZZ184_3442 [Cyanobacteriota bacterium]|jgi:hypothetical protein
MTQNSSSKDPILSRRETINPYRHFARQCLEIGQRLLWDMNTVSWMSRRNLKKIKNSHLGEKAVVLGNGPSLLKHDLSLIDNTFTFGQNKINLLFDKSSFRPACIVAVDPIILNQNAHFYNETNIPLFLNHQSSNFIKHHEHITFLYNSSLGSGAFARDCSLNIGCSATVSYTSLQLAFHMGFSDIALIGCDHNYQTNQRPNTLVVTEGEDKNHFDPNYIQTGESWQVMNMLVAEVGYSLARDVFSAHGRRVVNCTEGGKLEIFERKNLKSWLLESWKK